MSSRFTLILCWYGNQDDRLKLFNATLKSIAAQSLSRDKFEVIIIRDINSSYTALESVANKTISLPHRDLFDKAWFINVAARNASSEWIFVMDADIITDENYLQAVYDYMGKTKNYVFVPFNIVLRKNEDGSSNRLEYYKENIFGIGFCIKKKEFFEAGGMCESFDGYGCEDREICERHKANKENMVYTVTHQFHRYTQDTLFKHNVHLMELFLKHKNEMERRQYFVKDRVGNPLGPTPIYYGDLS